MEVALHQGERPLARSGKAKKALLHCSTIDRAHTNDECRMWSSFRGKWDHRRLALLGGSGLKALVCQQKSRNGKAVPACEAGCVTGKLFSLQHHVLAVVAGANAQQHLAGIGRFFQCLTQLIKVVDTDAVDLFNQHAGL